MSHISFSELKEWTTCAWKHKLSYIDKIRVFQGNEFTAFGTALHTVCENLVTHNESNTLTQYNAKESFQQEFIKNLKLLKESAKDVSFNTELIQQMRLQGDFLVDKVLPALKSYFGKFELINVEEKLYEDIAGRKIKFKGFIDLVIFTPKDKKYHIIDWKTCSWGWDSRKRSEKMITYQLTLYKHFWCEKNKKDYNEVLTHFALLKRTAKKDNVEIFKVTNGTKKIENALKLLNKSLYNIDKKNYIKNRLSCYGKYGVCEFYKSEHCK